MDHFCDAYRFHNFEANVRTGLLLRDGQRIRIEELPFRLLLILLEQPGQVVSKKELRDRLWGEKTFGEFDNSLHVAAGKLREALRDRSGDSQLIETIRRRGYKFNGDVETIFDSPAPLAFFENVTSEVIETRVARWPLLRAAAGLALVLALAVVTIIGVAYRHRHRPLSVAGDEVVLGGFTNATGDDSYSGLTHAFRLKLEESPYLNILPDRPFRQIVSEPDRAALPEQLKGCASLGGKILLTGQLIPERNGYKIVTNAWDCPAGRLLSTETAHAETKEHILPALDLGTEQMRRRLGESDISIARFNVPLAQATTASPAALKAFTLGEEKRSQGQEFESIANYKLAIDLDPQFALAHARLGTIYSNAGESALSASYYKKAFEMRERTTDRERLYIAAHYYSFATGEIQRSIDAFELWHSIYPRDASPVNNLAVEYLSIGQPAKAEEMARAAVQLDPSSGFSYAILARVYLETQNLKELKTMCTDVTPGRRDVITLHESCYLLDFLQNDNQAMQQQVEWARGNPAEGELLDEAAWVAMYRGKISDARRLFSQARQAALDHKFVEMAATVDLDEASLEADLSYATEARRHALDALALVPKSANTQSSAALAFARSGDLHNAQIEEAEAAAQAPLDTILNVAELASVRAAVQLQNRNPTAAIQSLEQTRPLDLCTTMALAPAYYRGLAYLQNHQAKEAILEFRRVVDHRALAPDSPYIALSDLNLGLALQHLGDRSNADLAYHEAETIWKDADPDFIPMRQLQCLHRSLTGQTSSTQCQRSLQHLLRTSF
jgi:DNA-binding winged helix-turn-helix (wHTH) protein/tetratricopeptide (TPR) repeat protein